MLKYKNVSSFYQIGFKIFLIFPWYFNLLSSSLDGLGRTGEGERLDNLTEFVVGIFLKFFPNLRSSTLLLSFKDSFW